VPGNDVSDIVNITAMAVFESQRQREERLEAKEQAFELPVQAE
jgi:hypothetical protein